MARLGRGRGAEEHDWSVSTAKEGEKTAKEKEEKLEKREEKRGKGGRKLHPSSLKTTARRGGKPHKNMEKSLVERNSFSIKREKRDSWSWGFLVQSQWHLVTNIMLQKSYKIILFPFIIHCPIKVKKKKGMTSEHYDFLYI